MDLGTTKWHNPTAQAVKLEVFVAPGQVNRYEVPAGGSLPIPSAFDHAIHQMREGVIVGGLAPQLTRDGVHAEVHPALRPAEAAKPASNVKAR